ncbi:MAG: glutaminase A [Planctomycetes bacterium]|nr:glutaminase A [Planctomycetota bacterium]
MPPLDPAALQPLLEALHERHRDLADGRLADYIPELARADPSWFGVAVATVDGRVLAVGDHARPFTIQSISKVLAHGLALEDHGRDEVLARVGVEPTGDPFDSIIRVDRATKRPHNPMVNAGAIAVASLIRGGDPTTRLNRVLAMFGRYVGHEVLVDMPVFLSERSTAHRNRAIAHLMRNFAMIEANVEETLDLYLQLCSARVTCRDLAVIGATLAGGGICPLTGERAIEAGYIRDLLSVMFTCGLYDAAGRWAYSVGLPAKSGVSGGLLAVVPGQLGIAVYSPPVDARGNSVRGVRVCEDLSRQLGLHVFGGAWPAPPPAVDRPTLEAELRAAHDALAPLREGAPCAYIPELARVDPDLFAIAACTVQGEVLAVGDAAAPFTIQSIANVFGYGLALEGVGREVLERFVDVEPSGNPFNAITLDERTKHPPNPLINSGAIAVAALQPGGDLGARLARVLGRLSDFAGRALRVDEATFRSEWATADRNRAIAYLLRNFGLLAGDLDEALELYVRACAVAVDARDLAVMAATLAHGGVNPRTGVRALGPDHARDVLSVMFTCGLNESAGEWAYRVGLPAKSGVGGGLLAVVPGVLGLAIFSPRLDPRGNSVKGVRACERLSERLGLHAFGAPAT